MGRYGLGYWCVLSLASDFRAVWLVWIQVGERASGKAFGAKTLRLMLSLSELLNTVWVYKAEVDDCKSKKCIVKFKNENIFTFIGNTFFNSIN